MAWLQQQLARERPDTLTQTVVVVSPKSLAWTGRTIHFPLQPQRGLSCPVSDLTAQGEVQGFLTILANDALLIKKLRGRHLTNHLHGWACVPRTVQRGCCVRVPLSRLLLTAGD